METILIRNSRYFAIFAFLALHIKKAPDH